MPRVYGAAFAESTSSLKILLVGAVFASVAKVASVYLVTQGQMVSNVISVSAGVLVTIVLDILLIPRFGIEGASIATSVSYIAIFVVIVFSIRYKLNVKELNYFVPDLQDFRQMISRLRK